MSILEMRGIYKAFDGVPVLKGVDLTIEKGEIHAILGENGAGKSTLMNILTGVVPMDAGRIVFDGQPVPHPTVPLTEKLGIAFVHQELNLFPTMKAYENLFLCREYTNRFGMLKKRQMIERARRLFEELGIDIEPEELVSELRMGQKQLLEIAKALLFDAKLLILDEPTTALNNEEIDHLFGILRTLRRTGKSFIFISHKMPEIFALCDRYTVLRNGEFIAQGSIADTDARALTHLMVGSSFDHGDVYRKRPLGEEVLSLRGVSGPGFENVTFSAKRGEILALTGLQGSGSSELMQGLFGALPVEAGELVIEGRRFTGRGIHQAMRAKVAMLPSNRKENSVVPDMSILENMALSEQTLSFAHQHISRRAEDASYERMKKLLGIKAGRPSDGITSLSGGNQQKIFLAKWLLTEGEILLLDNPTQGIDVGSKAEIYQLILRLAEAGKTILINTLEISEIQKVADECAVFYDGRLLAILPHEKIDEQTVMMYSTNAVETMEGREHD